MNNLALSNQTKFNFKSLKSIFKKSIFLENSLEIQLECKNLIIGIHQIERYEQDVSCFFKLKEGKITFSFKDVAYAITGNSIYYSFKDKQNLSTQEKNNYITEQFIKFCIRYQKI